MRNGYGTFAIEYGDERPEEWKEGVIVPIVKRGEGERVEEYKGITLLTMTYKIKKLRYCVSREVEGGNRRERDDSA